MEDDGSDDCFGEWVGGGGTYRSTSRAYILLVERGRGCAQRLTNQKSMANEYHAQLLGGGDLDVLLFVEGQFWEFGKPNQIAIPNHGQDASHNRVQIRWLE